MTSFFTWQLLHFQVVMYIIASKLNWTFGMTGSAMAEKWQQKFSAILGFKSEQYFCTLDFCVFNLWRPPWVFFIKLFALFKYNFWGLIQLLQNCWELLRKELSGHLWPLLLYLVSICPPKSIVATLLNRFLRLSLNENLLLSNFLSYFFPLVPCFGEF